ncbi:MAG: hypothetical protein AAGA44_15610 [Pseudomonadota bacterium]
MKGLQLLLASIVATTFAIGPIAANADDELAVTMEVIDDLEGLEADIALMQGPVDNLLEDEISDSDIDDKDDRGILDQFEDMDGAFDIDNDNDGFEFDDEEKASNEAFDAEDDFEEGEDVDDDEFDIIEEPDDDMDDEIDVQIASEELG